MANFVRANPAGWAFGAILTNAQINAMDVDHAKSVNGDNGGTWAGAIVWTGAHTFQNKITLSGNPAGICYRAPSSTLGDANADISVLFDTWIFTAALGAAPRAYTLRHTLAGAIPTLGQRIRVRHPIATGGAIASFKREDATVIGRLNNATGYSWIEFEYEAAGWRCCAGGGPMFEMVA